jgi:hypothetical protein
MGNPDKSFVLGLSIKQINLLTSLYSPFLDMNTLKANKTRIRFVSKNVCPMTLLRK